MVLAMVSNAALLSLIALIMKLAWENHSSRKVRELARELVQWWSAQPKEKNARVGLATSTESLVFGVDDQFRYFEPEPIEMQILN